MKKTVLLLTVLFAVAGVNAQSLEEIVNKYSSAIKADKLASVKTIKISGKMSAMGMEMPMTMYMKNPNKIKVVYSMGGQEMASAYDGVKGYTINPMSGSNDPVEITGDQLRQVQNNNIFSNEILNYFKSGKLTLDGEENVDGKPAFRLKAESGSAGPVTLYLDKTTFLPVKSKTTTEQMGTSIEVESLMSNYMEVDGVVMPGKTTAMANGMEAGVITFEKIEVNIPIEDSVFSLK